MSGAGVWQAILNANTLLCLLLIRLPNQDREAVFPTRQSLGAMKNKLKGAETGHSLLKRKSEALTKYVFQ